jgi:hypothetical protein
VKKEIAAPLFTGSLGTCIVLGIKGLGSLKTILFAIGVPCEEGTLAVLAASDFSYSVSGCGMVAND